MRTMFLMWQVRIETRVRELMNWLHERGES